MPNVTANKIVYLKSGEDLTSAIRASLEAAANAVLEIHPDVDGDLDFTAFVHRTKYLLESSASELNEAYISNAFILNQTKSNRIDRELYFRFTLESRDRIIPDDVVYAKGLKQGVGAFLLHLHCSRAIILPFSFSWPLAQKRSAGNVLDIGIKVCTPMLAFLRSLIPSEENSKADAAFAPVCTSRKTKEQFRSYGPKLLIATGWLTPEEANVGHLLDIKQHENDFAVDISAILIKPLIEVLSRKYPGRFSITESQWTSLTAHRKVFSSSNLDKIVSESINPAEKHQRYSDNILLEQVENLQPGFGSAEAVRARDTLPGLDVDLAAMSKNWLYAQELYMRTIKRENYKTTITALGYLNNYLFVYLPYWIQGNPATSLVFPANPSQFVGSIYVSRLAVVDALLPRTFLDVMGHISRRREWKDNSYYAIIKQIEIFFKFVERHSDEIPGCKEFKQPIPYYAFPRSSRLRLTNKAPIPRRLFGVYLDYVESLISYGKVVEDKIQIGELDGNSLESRLSRFGRVIDTAAIADIVGFIPVLFHKGNTIPLRIIPNCLNLRSVKLVEGRTELLPHPHALNQILVAWYTGLRHQHIQWLDVRTFDHLVNPEDIEFAKLHVNTDKAKTMPWTTSVNFRVIEVLREQKRWRDAVDNQQFADLHYYEHNPDTKWPKILPLFACGSTGSPHPDVWYEDAWFDILAALDSLKSSLGLDQIRNLVELLPPGIKFGDPRARWKKNEYGAKQQKVCKLTVKSDITPHSSRVTVVSQYSTLLPADIIGQRVTGQTAGTVYHYQRLDPEEMEEARVHQAMHLRRKAQRDDFNSVITDGRLPSRFIRADDVNSALAKSMKADVAETIVSYGCVSITLNEDATSGLDILRETRGINAAFNKTEICPYGNLCPPEIIRQWRGSNRCGLCQYAVRSIDHLPALAAKIKQFDEYLEDLTGKIETAAADRFSEEEFERLENERSRIAEELSGWKVSEEMLNIARIHVASGQSTRKWVVQMPEIILQDLARVSTIKGENSYLLDRLMECVAYPMLESPRVRAKLDVVRRELLARRGNIHAAISSSTPADLASECVGLLRSLAESHKLTYDDFVAMLGTNRHLDGLSKIQSTILALEDGSDSNGQQI